MSKVPYFERIFPLTRPFNAFYAKTIFYKILSTCTQNGEPNILNCWARWVSPIFPLPKLLFGVFIKYLGIIRKIHKLATFTKGYKLKLVAFLKSHNFWPKLVTFWSKLVTFTKDHKFKVVTFREGHKIISFLIVLMST